MINILTFEAYCNEIPKAVSIEHKMSLMDKEVNKEITEEEIEELEKAEKESEKKRNKKRISSNKSI